jgi:DNA-binding NarL/FixJ family response regulator
MNDSDTISLAIVEDDPQIRSSLQIYLDMQDEFGCSGVYHSVEALLNRLDQSTVMPKVILMDIGLPGMSGIEGMKIINEKYPEIDIIMLTVYHESDKIFQSLCAGASGYLLKNTPLDEIKEGILSLASGGSPMSPQIARKVIEFFNPSKNKHTNTSPLSIREKEIVVGLVDGLSYKMIADRMNISIETVRFHIKKIYKKLHVNCKAEVISKSLKGEI